MDAGVVAAGAVAGLTIAACWLDLRRQTNGSGPIATEIKNLKADIREMKADIHEVKADIWDLRCQVRVDRPAERA